MSLLEERQERKKRAMQAAHAAHIHGDNEKALEYLAPFKSDKQVAEIIAKINKKTKSTTKSSWSKNQQTVLKAIPLFIICGAIWVMVNFGNNNATTPEGKVNEAVSRAFGEQTEFVFVSDTVVTVRLPLSDLSAELARSDAELNFPILVCELRERGLTGRTYQMQGSVPVTDDYGNLSTVKAVEIIIRPEQIDLINCENARNYLINLPAISESYVIYPIIQN